jgi:hypothetical protein
MDIGRLEGVPAKCANCGIPLGPDAKWVTGVHMDRANYAKCYHGVDRPQKPILANPAAFLLN